MVERKLDWIPNPDERSLKFAVARTDCYASGSERRHGRMTWYKHVFLDQGTEGACTGFGAAHVLSASPRRRPQTDETAHSIYQRAKTLDEWPGENYDGSSVNGAMKAMREMGLIKEWRWCYSMSEIRHALSWHGAIEIGVWWYSGMFSPDSNGFIAPTGGRAGGHALMLNGFRRLNGSIAYRLENSWGPGWGDNGGCFIWDHYLQELLHDGGEFAIPLKV